MRCESLLEGLLKCKRFVLIAMPVSSRQTAVDGINSVRFRNPRTIHSTPDRGGHTMAHVIGNDCTNCGACVDSCPVNSIAPAGDKHKIDADTCIDCGACVDTCPVSAISAG
jgi:NAD-dependent dihydropyrimidine dehydrogenase PreA subunit